MAKQRYINTRFWNDSYVADLDPIEKLLFIYFLTNEHTNIAGLYEVPLKIVAIETGLDRTMLEKVMPRLEEKVRYVDGYIVIRKYLKHQESMSDKVRRGVVAELSKIPKELLQKVVENGWYEIPETYPMDTLSIPYTHLDRDRDRDLDRDRDTNVVAGKPAQAQVVEDEEETPAQEAYDFFSSIEDLAQGGQQIELTERLAALSQRLNVQKPVLWREVQAFALYWTERTKNGKKQRWQLEPTFEVDRRLLTWLRRASQGPPRGTHAPPQRGKEIIGLVPT